MLSFFLCLTANAEPEVSLTYKVDQKIGIWAENISGNILYNPQDVFYTSRGFAIKKNNGFKNLNIYGGIFYTTEKPKDAISIQKAKGTESYPGYKIEEKERTKSSVFFIQLPNKKKKVIGRGHNNLTPYRWFTHAANSKLDFTKPDSSFGWNKEGENYLYAIPTKSTSLSSKKATPDDIQKWNKQVQIFSPKIKITHGMWVNTDFDETLEQVACGVGPRFKSCLIYDPEENIWHNTQLHWDSSDYPLPFSYNKENYIAYRAHPKSKILRVLYFDGLSYRTEFFRPKNRKR